MKVVFIGHPGSGKTYAATALAKRIGIQETDIDALLDNLVYFYFRKPYRRAFNTLLKDKREWIIGGYGGKRMPATFWDEADSIVYINLPSAELRQNVYYRYKSKKTKNESSHSQERFMNVLKNLGQIHVLNGSLQRFVHDLKLSPNANKLIEVHSRRELEDVIDRLASKR